MDASRETRSDKFADFMRHLTVNGKPLVISDAQRRMIAVIQDALDSGKPLVVLKPLRTNWLDTLTWSTLAAAIYRDAAKPPDERQRGSIWNLKTFRALESTKSSANA